MRHFLLTSFAHSERAARPHPRPIGEIRISSQLTNSAAIEHDVANAMYVLPHITLLHAVDLHVPYSWMSTWILMSCLGLTRLCQQHRGSERRCTLPVCHSTETLARAQIEHQSGGGSDVHEPNVTSGFLAENI